MEVQTTGQQTVMAIYLISRKMIVIMVSIGRYYVALKILQDFAQLIFQIEA